MPRRPSSRRAQELVKDHPPTAEEVQRYLDARGERRFTGAQFVDVNTAAGWVQGKARKPLVDWQAHVRTWCRLRDEWGEVAGEAEGVGAAADPPSANARYAAEIERFSGDPRFAAYRKLVVAGTVAVGFERWKAEVVGE